MCFFFWVLIFFDRYQNNLKHIELFSVLHGNNGEKNIQTGKILKNFGLTGVYWPDICVYWQE